MKVTANFDAQAADNANSCLFLQESRFKNYFHQLNWLLKLYHNICDQVPSPLRKLMAPLTESVQYYLHPGLSTLTWNSMNIDAFLHQVRKLEPFSSHG